VLNSQVFMVNCAMPAAKPAPSETLTMSERYQNLNTKQVMKYLGVTSRESVWKDVREGRLPKPRYLAPHRPVWRLGEVIDHLEGKLQPFEAEARGFKGDSPQERKEKIIKAIEKPQPKEETPVLTPSKKDALRARFGLKRK
jgi:predicted DNA-binding transcriptional regulator AlpA